MIHHETHLVTEDNGPRPAGEPDRCFYCHKPKGTAHEPQCVCRERTVVVRAIVEYVVAVPESWEQDQLEFHRNESSWCAGNMLEELAALDAKLDEMGLCLCPMVRFEYVREAEIEDERVNFGPEGWKPASESESTSDKLCS